MDLISLLELGIRHAAPILLIAMGCLFSSKVGIFNLALEGFTLLSCFFSVVGAYFSNNVWVGVLCGLATGVLTSMIYAVFILKLKVNPVICALSINTLVTGLTRYLLKPIFNTSGRFVLSSSLALPTIHFDFLENAGIFSVMNDKTILVHFAFLLPFILYYVLYHTEFGMNMRVVGLNEEAAVATGVNTNKIKYTALLMNGILCGLAGAELALEVYMFNVGMTNGRGYTALSALSRHMLHIRNGEVV
jgi:simple sugar transport system permease protein